jgi:ABC-2 type transport system permease protein
MMGRMLQSELLKLRTTRTFLALVGAAVALGLLISALSASLIDNPTKDDLRNGVLADTSSLFILVLGIVGATGEWRHRTIAGSLLAAPDRRRFVAAKAIAYAAAGVVLSLVVTIAVAVVSMTILGARGEPTLGIADIADVLWRNLLLAAAFGALGVGIGALIRNQPTAIVVVLVTLFIVEPTVSALAPDVGKYGPFLGTSSGLSASDDTDVLPAGAAILVLLGWVALACVAAAETLARRDVT